MPVNPQIPTAQLWLATPNTLNLQAANYLRAQFCTKLRTINSPTDTTTTTNLTDFNHINPLDQLCNCHSCQQINARQHPQILFIQPAATGYTVDLVQPILTQLSYQLAPTETFWLVLSHVDQLSTVCANLLLKALEEPPAGYHFILLAQRYYQVLPTIRSRCQISYLPVSLAPLTPTPALAYKLAHPERSRRELRDEERGAETTKELYEIFTYQKVCSADQFLQILNRLTLTDQEQLELLDQIILYWSLQVKAQYKTQLLVEQQQSTPPSTFVVSNFVQLEERSKIYRTTEPTNQLTTAQLAQITALLQQQLLQPPVRGSAKICWRDLFIQLYQVMTS